MSDPRALTAQERCIVHYVGLAASNKEIAFTLGLPLSSVESAVGSLLRKLRCGSRAELVALGPPSAWSTTRVELGGGELDLVEVNTEATDPRFAALTDAERRVAACVLCGDSNEEIAHKRRASVRTVANQLRAIYRKLAVTSRLELVRRFAPDRERLQSVPVLPTTSASRPRSSDTAGASPARLPSQQETLRVRGGRRRGTHAHSK